jgi:hypothetical protein
MGTTVFKGSSTPVYVSVLSEMCAISIVTKNGWLAMGAHSC